MKRSWLWWGLPFALAGLVLLIAPPVSLTDPQKKPKIEIRSAHPESIDLPGYTPRTSTAQTAGADPMKPVAPRTREELQQVRAALKEQEKSLLARRKGLDPNDRAAAQALVDEIEHYNDDIRSFEEASAKLEPETPAKAP
jgi:hypothetical protein